MTPHLLGPLRSVITPNVPKDALKTTIVLLHGYGASGADLVGLSQELSVPAGTQFVFLEAPLALDGAGAGARAWWHIDMMQLQVAQMTGQTEHLSRGAPDGLPEAREALTLALEDLIENHGVKKERLILGGFSQGAMLSTDFALRSGWPLLGLVALSGTIICRDEWLPLLQSKKGFPVFQSHSPDDTVLPMAQAEKLSGWMKDAGLSHQFVSFRGGHGISRDVLAGLNTFLSGLCQG